MTLARSALRVRPRGGLELNQDQGRRTRRYITALVQYGDPNTAKLEADPFFDAYEGQEQATTFGKRSIHPSLDDFYGMQPDFLNKERCELWAAAPYWGEQDYISFKTALVKQQGENEWHEEIC
jgi:hypothetical protein